jgi:D-3-phosphoglycerate dehydrogenase
MSERVNLVNSLAVAAERGMSVTSSTSLEVRDFVNIVEIEISGRWGTKRAEGALFGKREPRLVTLDGYRIDAKPIGEMILIFNRDVPGVIGAVGECLGARNVNLAGFYNGREAIGGKAIILLNVDTPVTDDTLACLASLPNIMSAKRILV